MQRLGVIKPKRSTKVDSSPFGFNYGSNAFNAPEAMELILDRAAETGFKWMRLSVSWSQVETEGGVYDFSQADPLIVATLAHGFAPYLLISGGNALYTEVPSGRPTDSEAALAAWQDFIRAAVRHYSAMGVKHWEIWNEPNWGVSWHGHHFGNPPEYARLVIAAAEAIRGTDPEAVILAGSLVETGIPRARLTVPFGARNGPRDLPGGATFGSSVTFGVPRNAGAGRWKSISTSLPSLLG